MKTLKLNDGEFWKWMNPKITSVVYDKSKGTAEGIDAYLKWISDNEVESGYIVESFCEDNSDDKDEDDKKEVVRIAFFLAALLHDFGYGHKFFRDYKEKLFNVYSWLLPEADPTDINMPDTKVLLKSLPSFFIREHHCWLNSQYSGFSINITDKSSLNWIKKNKHFPDCSSHEQVPLAMLLILADELSLWGRPKLVPELKDENSVLLKLKKQNGESIEIDITEKKKNNQMVIKATENEKNELGKNFKNLECLESQKDKEFEMFDYQIRIDSDNIDTLNCNR